MQRLLEIVSRWSRRGAAWLPLVAAVSVVLLQSCGGGSAPSQPTGSSPTTTTTMPAAPKPDPPNTGTCDGVPAPNRCDVGNGSPPATARCNDKLWSCSKNRSGTCSGHGGVACWVCPGPLC